MSISTFLPFTQVVTEGTIGIILAFLGWVAIFPIRTSAQRIKAEWFRVTAQIDQVQNELTTQRTNCLATLSGQGDKQVELLEQAVETLRDIHTSQSEMSGFLKGSRRDE